ncbi:peptidoglycan bridge formation glycyltransferase FemA/FemB family protein [Candidatus Dojkabacteria bacterium]|nr:peptidoglycan bridge formation glycyltransferase FemA/FemB family protein [Candidatus Dojkabacteria bacterium]
MIVSEIKDRSTWDEFLRNCSYNYFLQTWEWGDFNELMGTKVFRLGFYDNSKLVAVCLGLEIKSRFGNYIYCPRGPILEWENEKTRTDVITTLVDFFKTKGYFSLRIDPAIKESSTEITSTIRSTGFVDAVNFIQVERSWMLDINGKSDDELFSGMRKNTRYYIRRAQKLGVTVRVSDKLEDLDTFINMINQMSKRKNFHALPSEYFRNQFNILNKAGMQKVIVAEYKGKTIATALIVFYGNEGSYLHAASSEENGSLQAPYLLQWEAIKHARSVGLSRYNFWGVVKDSDYHPGHPGFGYSNFKKGFGGYLEVYMRTKDYVYKPFQYNLFKIQELYRLTQKKGV